MVAEMIDKRLIRISNIPLEIRYFQDMTLTGNMIYSFEARFDHYDRVVLDNYSLKGLEDKVRYILPAAFYSRIIAGIIQIGSKKSRKEVVLQW